jgi:hypothetical protein
MRHCFIDTNVLLDFPLWRDGFGPDALGLFAAGESGQVTLYASGLSFSHIYYTMRKTNTAAERLAALADLAASVEIVPIGRTVIEAAITLGFTDFEDGLQYCAARSVPAIQAIVTRAYATAGAGAARKRITHTKTAVLQCEAPPFGCIFIQPPVVGPAARAAAGPVTRAAAPVRPETAPAAVRPPEHRPLYRPAARRAAPWPARPNTGICA